MAKNTVTSEIIDGILRVAVGGSAITAALVLPGLAVALDKPLDLFFNTLDKRARERELARILSYMKSQRLLKEYEHGLLVTAKGQERLSRAEFERLSIPAPKTWDTLWRVVFYDIPEKHQAIRRSLSNKLRNLRFYQLQRSVWVHPFPCREILIEVSKQLCSAKYTSLIEAPYIDNQIKLIERFQKHYPTISFK